MLAVVWVPMLFMVMAERSDAQAIFEYGKQTGALKESRRGVNTRSPAANRHSVNAPAGSQAPVSALLAVKQSEVHLYARQDEYSPLVAKLERGDTLTVMAKAAGSSGLWYMVKSSTGAVGWVRASDLEQ